MICVGATLWKINREAIDFKCTEIKLNRDKWTHHFFDIEEIVISNRTVISLWVDCEGNEVEEEDIVSQ